MLFKVVKVLKNHPKKSLAFAGVLTVIGNYAKGKYEENLLMQSYCQEALTYGHLPYRASDERHITVLLNPAANNGKGKAKYEKYCAPLLHLAGMKVALVRTEHEDEAKQMMDVMDNTSAVVVAGGDGTLSEILTGLLRRDDQKSAAKRFPLGILPLGASNTAASSIWGFNKTPEVRHLAEATMAIVRNVKMPLDVMEITPLESSSDGETPKPSKPVFAASLLEWGAFRDAQERKDIYWYWAFLKKYMVYVFSSYKDLAWNCAAELEFSPPCFGCSRCRSQEESINNDIIQRPKRWWEAFVPRTKTNSKQDEEEIDYSKIINEECGTKQLMKIDNISDVRISTCNTPETKNVPGYSLDIKLGKENLSSLDFIKEGFAREWNQTRSHDQESFVGEVLLKPQESSFKDNKGIDRKFSIDNDEFEVRPMKIKPRPKAVTIFAQMPTNSL